MKNMFKVIASMACALALAACGGGGRNTDTTPVAVQPAFQTIDHQGDGTVAANGNLVTVNYTGYLYDEKAPDKLRGAKFETTVSSDPSKTPDTPIAFVLGVGQKIVGWDQGIVGMKVGGTRTLIIPANLAYGASERTTASGVVIPANSALVFDVTLIAVKQQ